jgi:hypothetical protein
MLKAGAGSCAVQRATSIDTVFSTSILMVILDIVSLPAGAGTWRATLGVVMAADQTPTGNWTIIWIEAALVNVVRIGDGTIVCPSCTAGITAVKVGAVGASEMDKDGGDALAVKIGAVVPTPVRMLGAPAIIVVTGAGINTSGLLASTGATLVCVIIADEAAKTLTSTGVAIDAVNDP